MKMICREWKEAELRRQKLILSSFDEGEVSPCQIHNEYTTCSAVQAHEQDEFGKMTRNDSLISEINIKVRQVFPDENAILINQRIIWSP